ncbi:MAG: hypothetical protein QNJ78_03885 [Gammaproteobacteria bacterium]|nr:hypothetical protein [Gammaproteobacteria bacterium]
MAIKELYLRQLLPLIGLLMLLSSGQSGAATDPDTTTGIHIRLDRGYLPESLSILLDNKDITALAKETEDGILVKPPQALDTGKHRLLVSFISAEGYQIRRRIELEQGQENRFYDGASGLGITLRGKLHDRQDTNEQDHELDAHFDHGGDWRNGSWSGEVNADVWWFDRGTDIDPLENHHPEVIYYYVSARSQQDGSGLLAEAGQIQLQQSRNTFSNLARRGARFSFQGEGGSLGLFSVNSQQYLGSRGGIGLGDGDDGTIIGLSAGWSPLQSSKRHLQLRALYNKGASEGESFGMLNNATPDEGDVTALVLASRFTDLGLELEVEVDRSRYDADTSDNEDAINDEAYGLRLRGGKDWIKYRFAYEHIGTNYAVVANPLLKNDREYVTLGADFDLGNHGFGLSSQVERDNLDDEPTRARLNKTYLAANYVYRRGRSFSSSLSLQQQRLDSKDEPSASSILDSRVDSMLGKISVSNGHWNHLFSLLISNLDDATAFNNDSEILSVTYSPSLVTGNLTLIPSYSHTETEFSSGQHTRQGIWSLHLQGRAFRDRFNYQLSASLSNRQDELNMDVESTYLVARGDWSLNPLRIMGKRMRHSVGVELEWRDSDSDDVTTQDDALAWLTYSITAGNKQ